MATHVYGLFLHTTCSQERESWCRDRINHAKGGPRDDIKLHARTVDPDLGEVKRALELDHPDLAVVRQRKGLPIPTDVAWQKPCIEVCDGEGTRGRTYRGRLAGMGRRAGEGARVATRTVRVIDRHRVVPSMYGEYQAGIVRCC